MLPFFRNEKPKKAYIALDIGSTTIKALAFTIEEKYNKKNEVIGKRAIIQGVGKVKNGSNDFNNTTITDIAGIAENCKKAIHKSIQRNGLKPTQFLMGVAGEFVKGVTSINHYEREEEQENKINLSELRNIVHKLEWKSFAETRKELSQEMGFPEIDIKLISSAILNVIIDGYKVSNPLGFQGKNLQMSIFNAFSPGIHYDALQAIAGEIGMELLGIISEPYALSRCLNEYTNEESVILIDIGGTTTDITVVEKGVILGTKMFGIGSHSITKRLTTELNIAMEEAEKIKTAYANDKLENKSKKLIEKIIETDVDLWLSGVVLALSEFTNSKSLPSKILLCGGGAELPEIKECLNQTKWYQKLPFNEKPEIGLITASHLTNNIIDETRELKNAEDVVPLALANSAIELLEEEAVMQSILKKVIGIMKV